MKTKRFLACTAAFAAIIACACLFTCCGKVSTNPIDRALDYLHENTDSLTAGSVGGDWTAMVFARVGMCDELLDEYTENVRAYIVEKEGKLHSTRYTEYSRTVLALICVGENPRYMAGYDIAAPLLDFDAVTRQGVNGAAWALIALDALEADFADISTVREQYVSYIASAQNEDGSIGGLAGSEVDMTAMCLRALAPYTERAKIAAVCEKGIEFIAARQGTSGGFPSPYGESSETVAQVLLALDALEIKPDDLRFEADISLVDVLLSYQNKDGGFSHNIGGKTDRIATEQAVLALLEYGKPTEVSE